MRRSSIASTAFAAFAAVVVGSAAVDAAASQAQKTHIAVAPSIGWSQTRFLVSFVAPTRTGRFGESVRRYLISADGPSRSGCSSSDSVEPPAAPKGTQIKALLVAPSADQRWCLGAYKGQVEEIQTAVCPPEKPLCPTYVIFLRTIGRFRFTVGHPGPGSDTTPPQFAGIRRAFACTPGAQRPGETTPYHLSWNAATDNVTPSSKIVYDVYMSHTSGGEDFSNPTWITDPGVTGFETPGLPSHGSFYFVVRARDEAGNEDRNRVERRGLDPCV